MPNGSALTDQRREEIVMECGEALANRPLDVAWGLCRSYLDQYPDDAELALIIGSALPMPASAEENPAKREEYLQEAIRLCQPAVQSGDPKLRNSGIRMLTALYMTTDQLDKAEEMIRLENEGLYGMADLRLASILLRKGDLAQAELMFQQRLFELVSDFEMAIAGMASVSNRLGNTEREILLWETVPKLTDLLRLDRMSGNVELALTRAYASMDQPDVALDYLEKFVAGIENARDTLDFGDNPYFHRLTSGGRTVAVSGQDKGRIVEEVKTFREHPALQGNQRLEQLIARLQA